MTNFQMDDAKRIIVEDPTITGLIPELMRFMQQEKIGSILKNGKLTSTKPNKLEGIFTLDDALRIRRWLEERQVAEHVETVDKTPIELVESPDTTQDRVHRFHPMLEELRGCKLGRVLNKLGKVSRDQVCMALNLQAQRRRPIGQLLIELGYVKDTDVNEALGLQLGVETVNLDTLGTTQRNDGYWIDVEATKRVPYETARAYGLPIQLDNETNTLTIAVKEVSKLQVLNDLCMLMGFEVVKAVIASSPKQIDDLIVKYYGK